MKKIIFLTHVGDPGGAEYKMIELYYASADTSEIVNFRAGRLNQILEERGINHSEICMPEVIDGFKRQAGFKELVQALPAVISMIRRVAKKCKQFDYVVCMSQKSFIIASLAKIIMRKKIIWFMNDIVSSEHFGKTSLIIINIFSRLFADVVVLNSQASFDAWIQAGFRKERISIIYSGVNVEEIEKEASDTNEISNIKKRLAPNGGALIGLFARITPWKGQDVFLKALSTLPGINGVLVGEATSSEESYKESLQALSQEMKLDDRISFIGHSNEVGKYMAACDIIVHCSTSPEPFGRVIVEAMLVGRPVIATNAGGAKEIIISEESGLLSPLGDHIALSRAIARYLDSPKWAAELAAKGQRRAKEKFSTAVMLDDFKALL